MSTNTFYTKSDLNAADLNILDSIPSWVEVELAGKTPSINDIRTEFNIGANRAQRIQTVYLQGLDPVERAVEDVNGSSEDVNGSSGSANGSRPVVNGSNGSEARVGGSDTGSDANVNGSRVGSERVGTEFALVDGWVAGGSENVNSRSDKNVNGSRADVNGSERVAAGRSHVGPWASLIFNGSVSLSFNFLHSHSMVNGRAWLAVIMAIIPVFNCAFQSHDLVGSPYSKWKKAFVFVLFALSMVLSFNASASVAKPYFGQVLCWLVPIILDFASVLSLNTLTSKGDSK